MKKSDGTGMRRASSIVYGVFVLCALFLVNGYSQYAGITSIAIGIFIEYIAIFVFAAIAVKLFGGTGEVSSSSCRKLLFITIFYIVLNIFTFSVQKDVISVSWQVLLEGAPGSTPDYGVLPIVLLVIKLLLPVIALFLASMSTQEQGSEEVAYVVTDTIVEDEDEVDEIVEVDEVVVEDEVEDEVEEKEEKKKK